MDEDGEKRVRTKRSCSPESSEKRSGDEVDWVRDLPESLLFHVLLNLPTKDVVKSSVLSSKWRNLWRYAPGLDLDCRDFKEFNAVVSFIERFLSFNRESCLNKFKLRSYCDVDEETENDIRRWINTIVKQKVQYLDLTWSAVEIPPILYMCESLVSLKLCGVILPNLEFVSLPSLKAIVLEWVLFANDLALEMLISSCLVLESLTLCKSPIDNVKVLRVSSQSLLSFNYYGPKYKGLYDKDLVVEIDAPKLENLKLSHQVTASFIIKNSSSLVKADINIEFNFGLGKKFDPKDLPKRKMIRNFLARISSVKNLIIAPCTLEVIYDYSRCEPLPLFRNLSFLSVDFYDDIWEILPFFLESCPNLNSLVVESTSYPKERTSILSRPRRLLSSLEYVKIESSLDMMELKLVSYFLENSPVLKKVTLCLNDCSRKESVILRELLTIPRRSSSCQVVVL
ncbi:FBD-associated F-box protein At1g66320-like [Arabidopsis lyrata subsp. lyrata]|uniref:FBD-associated F-box protein At1g66320-like n=1 Tax=Arabidopsis lyrata subsp. lyrata TaxID=81972 RepID=UPI000A29DA82|nr:FBD-associated F-box protein At1g66320-like [Arabidopsis lyrata subsp. lyrata]|eukprot:XP_020885070.1 FBD-associated F-box protein At1g66320-like [Arabidopsis lyrata subsp. lyrata]